MKVIDQLKTLAVGYQYEDHKPTKYFSLESAEVPDHLLPNKNPVYETTAKLSVRQVGSWQVQTDIEKTLITEQAAHMVARELYGEVVDRLFGIVDILYEHGPRYDDSVLKEVMNLIDDLTLKDRYK